MLKESQSVYDIDSSETILKIEGLKNQIAKEDIKEYEDEEEEEEQNLNEILILSSDCKFH